MLPIKRAPSTMSLVEFSGKGSVEATVGIEKHMDLQLSTKPKGPLVCFFIMKSKGVTLHAQPKRKKDV